MQVDNFIAALWEQISNMEEDAEIYEEDGDLETARLLNRHISEFTVIVQEYEGTHLG